MKKMELVGTKDTVSSRMYITPKLTSFGRVRELTAAGSGTRAENKPGQGATSKMP
jgi:hypothetical protein